MSFALNLKKYFPFSIRSFKSSNNEINSIVNKIQELKLSPNFLEDFAKPRTGVIYNNDLLFHNNFSPEFLKNPKFKENFKEFDRICKGKKQIDNNFMEFIKTMEKEKISNLDLILLYKTSIAALLGIMNYKYTIETLNKVFTLLKDHSPYDALYISAKIDEAFINFRTSNNYHDLRNSLIEQIAKAKITDQPHLVIKGLLNLAQLYVSVSDFSTAKIYSKAAIKLYEKEKLNDFYLFRKVLSLQSNDMGERKFLKKIKNLDEEIKEVVMSDFYTSYLKNVNPNNPKSIYKRWVLINQLLEKVNAKNDIHHPALVILLMHKWILTYKLGRESISYFYFEKAKNLISMNPLLDDNFFFRFCVLGISEASNLDFPFDQILTIFNKLTAPNKLCFDLILYRTFSLYYSVTRGDDKGTVVSKFKELSKLYDSYFGNSNREQIVLLEKKLQEIGYI